METKIDSTVRLRRRRYAFIRVADEPTLDIRRFLRGQIAFQAETECALLCPVRGTSLRLTAEELGLMITVPSDRWLTSDEVRSIKPELRKRLLHLANRGILLCDPAPDGLKDVAEAEDLIEQTQWYDIAALHHGQSKWRRRDVLLPAENATSERGSIKKTSKSRGDVPGHFFRREDALARKPLRVPSLNGPLFDILLARHTTRAWRYDRPLPKPVLETMLYATFGAHGIERLSGNVALIKRTSPSAGALHPIDAYLLVTNVDGVASGLYHYETATHALALLERMNHVETRDVARVFTAGQTYFAEAHVLLVHVARLDRMFCKYARHRKAYKAVLMDSGHLSQTLYLTATHLGLGAFYTAAINDADIEARLRLRPTREGAIAISGFGIADDERDPYQFRPTPYRQTQNVTSIQ
jgi:putative peptide maturation dehydrogenase